MSRLCVLDYHSDPNLQAWTQSKVSQGGMVEPEHTHNPGNAGRTRAWDEANAWFLRLHSGTASDREREEFAAWCQQDALHDSQFKQVEAFWSALDGLSGQVRHGTPMQSGSQPPEVRRVRPVNRSGRWLARPVAIAAALALVILTAVLWANIGVWMSDYRTHAGEQTSLTLADGSTVHLNTRSALSVDFSDRRRALALMQGEALFEVAHDPARPFEVTVNGSVVRAIGTTFDVDLQGNRTTVSVVEGIVRLLHEGDSRDIPAGYRLAYEAGHAPGALEPIDRPRVTAWRQRELVFDAMPLDLIVEQLNRYRVGPILILDSRLKGTRLSGSVALDNPDHSLTMLQQVLPFRIVRVTPYLTLLSL